MESSIEKRNQLLSKRIMRRVYAVWAIRQTVHPVTMKVLLVILLVVRSTTYVSYANVFANMPTSLDMHAGIIFMKAAMYHAHPMTLMLLSSTVWLGVWIIADMLFRPRQAWF